MRAEPAAALAEVSARLWDGEIRDHHGLGLDRHIDEPHDLALFLALVADLLVHDHHYVPDPAVLVLGEFRNRHLQHREDSVRTVERKYLDAADLGVAQVVRRRLLRPLDELLAVDDLPHAALVGAVAEIDAIALRPGGHAAVQLHRHRPGRAGLLADEAEVADMDRLQRI